MIQNPIHLLALRKKVHATLNDGHSITILGWEKHHHCDFTRSLPTSMIIFLGSSPGSLPQNSGLFLFTRFIGHSLTNRVKSERGRAHLHPIQLGIHQIKDILQSCEEFFEPAIKPTTLSGLEETVVTNITLTPMSNDSACTRLLDYLTHPLERIPQMTNTEKFLAAFKQAAAQHVDGLVGSRVVGELRASSGITERTKHLVDSRLLQPVKRAGCKNAGWYRIGETAGPKATSYESPIPESLGARADFLLAEEPELLIEQAQLTIRQAEISSTLEVIQTLKELGGKIDSLLSVNE